MPCQYQNEYFFIPLIESYKAMKINREQFRAIMNINQKKLDTRKYISYDSISMNFKNRQN